MTLNQSNQSFKEPNKNFLKWKFLDAPRDVLEPREDFKIFTPFNKGNFQVFGASVRGLLHKHEGTHCDDWFEIGTSGEWTIITVADGAGSKKYSRIGARIACETATTSLKNSLESIQLTVCKTEEEWNTSFIRNNDGKEFPDKNINEAYKALLKAFVSAKNKLESKFKELHTQNNNTNKEHASSVEDLSCTLNIAIHYSSEWGSVVIACQIGDGLIGIVKPDGQSQILSKADSGGYAGEPKFLTSDRMCDQDVLFARTEVFAGSINALLVMTDGVSNDFFPEKGSPTRLWAELLVNGIPDFNPNQPSTTRSSINLKTYSEKREVVEKEPRTGVLIRLASDYIRESGIEESDLVSCPLNAWLAHGGDKIKGDPNPQNHNESMRLRLWLDSFYKKGGSKDDRTLVVLHCQGKQ